MAQFDADKLRAEREKLGLSLYALSRRSGVPYSTLHDLESGKTAGPSWPTWQRIRLALGCSAGDLSADDPKGAA